MTKCNVLWFSRHQLSDAQLADLVELYGDCNIIKIDKTITSAYEIKTEIEAADIVAIVAPLTLQAQFLKIAQHRPVLISRNHRVVQPDNTIKFIHGGWSQLKKVDIVIEVLTDHPAPEESIR